MAGPSLGKVCNGKVMASSGPELPLPAAAIGLVFSRTERASANFKRQQVLINVDQWNRDRRRSKDPVLSSPGLQTWFTKLILPILEIPTATYHQKHDL